MESTKPISQKPISLPSKRRGNRRIHIWYEDYLVVLDGRGDYILPWTAFYIEYDHERVKPETKWRGIKLASPPTGDGAVTPSTHGR